MVIVRHRFSQGSRDLMRLEGTTRSPIFTHLSASLNGLKVIRSYHAEKLCSQEFLSHVDQNTSVNFLIITTNRWAGIRFDLLSSLFLLMVTLCAIFARIYQQQISTADIALTLSYSTTLIGLFQWTIR